MAGNAVSDIKQRLSSGIKPKHHGQETANKFNKTTYVKLELDIAKRQIRLLRIETGRNQTRVSKMSGAIGRQFGKPGINCSLVIASLDDPELQFDALSYAWGDPHIRMPIMVNGKTFLTTTSLYEALRTFGHEDAVEGFLWVDALCINQCDWVERGHQVSMMGTIYRRARRVHIWLGLEGRYTRQTLDAMTKIKFGDLDAKIALSDRTFMDGLEELLSRPWFSRLWVVQEAIVATTSLLHCGNRNILFRNLKRSIADLLDNSLFDRQSVPDNLDEPSRLTLITAPTSIFETHDLYTGNQSDMDAMLNVIDDACWKRASDDRDRIYALLGFLPSSLNIIPDYSSTVEDVYTRASFQIITWSQSLSLLRFAGHRATTRLPTWVPNFRKPSRPVTDVSRDKTFCACSILPVLIQQPARDQLRVHALITNTIQVSVQKTTRIASSTDETSILRRVLLEWHNYAYAGRAADGAIRDKFWGTVTRGKSFVPEHRVLQPYDASTLRVEDLEKWLFEEDMTASDDMTLHFLSNFRGALLKNAFFVTESDSFGLAGGSNSIKKGDTITILAGSRLPFVLRRIYRESQQYYQVIGTCYVHGEAAI